jgi:hypothetical protein
LKKGQMPKGFGAVTDAQSPGMPKEMGYGQSDIAFLRDQA